MSSPMGTARSRRSSDARGNITCYEYNGFEGLKKTIYLDGTYEQVGYDVYRRVSLGLGPQRPDDRADLRRVRPVQRQYADPEEAAVDLALAE